MSDPITLTDAAEGRTLGPVTLADDAPAEMSFAEIAAECERIATTNRVRVEFSIGYDDQPGTHFHMRGPHVYVTNGREFEFCRDGTTREQLAAAERWAVEHHTGSLSELRAQIDAATAKLRALGEAV